MPSLTIRTRFVALSLVAGCALIAIVGFGNTTKAEPLAFLRTMVAAGQSIFSGSEAEPHRTLSGKAATLGERFATLGERFAAGGGW